MGIKACLFRPEACYWQDKRWDFMSPKTGKTRKLICMGCSSYGYLTAEPVDGEPGMDAPCRECKTKHCFWRNDLTVHGDYVRAACYSQKLRLYSPGINQVVAENTVSLSTYEHAMGRIKELDEEVKTGRFSRNYCRGLATSRLNEINCMKRQSAQDDEDLAKYAVHVKKLESTADRLAMEVVEWKDKCRKLEARLQKVQSIKRHNICKVNKMQCERDIRRGTISQQKKEIHKLRIGCLGCDEVGRLESEIERLKRVLDEFHDASFSMADKQMEDKIARLEYKLKEYIAMKDSWEGIAGRHKARLSKLETIKDRWKAVALKRTKRIRELRALLIIAKNNKEFWYKSCCGDEKKIEQLGELMDQVEYSKRLISQEVDNLASIVTRGRAITKEVQDGS